jgi:proteasome lid subunit RPN8/RPN11
MTAEENTLKKLLIPISLYTKMERQVIGDAPLEACGILGGTRSGEVLQAEWIYPARNQLRSPSQYQIDPVDQLQAFNDLEIKGLELVAIYHSHPAGPAYPSALDIERAYYPEAVQLIWSPGLKMNSRNKESASRWICRGFVINESQVREIDFTTSDEVTGQTS